MAPSSHLTNGGRISVLGKIADLVSGIRAPRAGLNLASSYVLKFAPMAESEARSLYLDLCGRASHLAYRVGVAFVIPRQQLSVASDAGFDHSAPKLIPENLQPQFAAGMLVPTRHTEPNSLFRELSTYAAINDERVLAALDLWHVTYHETTPRAQFLTYITILESLSLQQSRSNETIEWIDRILLDAEKFNDASLVGALHGLKKVSIRATIEGLIFRSAKQQGKSDAETNSLLKCFKKLYETRSKLTHSGTAEVIDTAAALEIVRIVLDAAIAAPEVVFSKKP